MTDAEQIIWRALRNRQLFGFKFRRQATIGSYIVDFLCVEAMLIVEIDGGQHDEARDAHRSVYLQSRGYRVVRYWNHDVIENPDGVLSAIGIALEEAGRPSPNPLP